MSSTKLALEQATRVYAANINNACDYLGARLIGPAAAGAARLGVVVEPEPGHDPMVGRLAIPYLSRAGVVTIKFRCMGQHDCKEEGHLKYLALHGSKPHLYNVNAFFDRSPYIGLCEGEIDALVLSHYADIPAVGCPGVNAWQPHFTRCFAGYDTVLVFADGDKPGRDMARMVAKELPNARIVYMPDDMDVNDTYVIEGPGWLRRKAGLSE